MMNFLGKRKPLIGGPLQGFAFLKAPGIFQISGKKSIELSSVKSDEMFR
jgi:hypothetical protein